MMWILRTRFRMATLFLVAMVVDLLGALSGTIAVCRWIDAAGASLFLTMAWVAALDENRERRSRNDARTEQE